ncbi:MAG TPA: hypothetical protein VIJ38_11070 [Acidobacteriaceae bacterium]
MIPFEQPGRGFSLRRNREADPHHERCFAATLEAVFDPRGSSGAVIYTENMLLDDDCQEGGPSGEIAATTAGNGGLRYEDFIHFFQAQYTRASIEAFSLANAGKSYRDAGLANPSRAIVFGRMAELFNEPLLHRGSLSLESALKRLGRQLYWGVTDWPLVDESNDPLGEGEVAEFKIGSHWDCHGFQTKGVLLELSPKVLANSRGKAKAHGHIIPPPYIYAAVVKLEEGINVVTHFLRVPAYAYGGSIFLIESEAERCSVQFAHAAGVALVKLHVSGDLRALGEKLWPFRTDAMGRLPNRPDAIAFIEGKVRIFYITDSSDGEYLKRVAESVAELQLFLAHPDVLVLPKTAESFVDGSWLQL